MAVTLLLGGARSGKSRHAEHIATASGHAVTYIATARAGDGEMSARIAQHRAERPPHWVTVEAPLHLGDAIRRHCAASSVLLVDCLTLWLANIMFASSSDYPDVGAITLPAILHDERADLLDALKAARGDIVLVSNEVGMGIVPMGAATRAFMDEAGRLNQHVAALADEVLFIAAGLPLTLKAKACSQG